LQLDVYGPVTLDNNYAYYGQDYGGEGNDRYSGDVIIEACQKMDSEIDFSQYDWNNDGDVDFVYVVYAGKGQADGGDANTIWPHSYDIESSRYYGNCTYSEKQCKFDGKRVQSYAVMSSVCRTTTTRITEIITTTVLHRTNGM
jgi:M6 family metalloprotease-like protein